MGTVATQQAEVMLQHLQMFSLAAYVHLFCQWARPACVYQRFWVLPKGILARHFRPSGQKAFFIIDILIKMTMFCSLDLWILRLYHLPSFFSMSVLGTLET